MREIEAKEAAREFHVEVADEVMNRIGYDEIPAFMRELHEELKRRFETMSNEAEMTAKRQTLLYTEVRDCFEPRAVASKGY